MGASFAGSLRAVSVSPDGPRVFVTGTSCASACSTDPVYDYATVAYAAKTGSQLWAARYPAGSGALFDALAVSPTAPGRS